MLLDSDVIQVTSSSKPPQTAHFRRQAPDRPQAASEKRACVDDPSSIGLDLDGPSESRQILTKFERQSELLSNTNVAGIFAKGRVSTSVRRFKRGNVFSENSVPRRDPCNLKSSPHCEGPNPDVHAAPAQQPSASDAPRSRVLLRPLPVPPHACASSDLTPPCATPSTHRCQKRLRQALAQSLDEGATNEHRLLYSIGSPSSGTQFPALQHTNLGSRTDPVLAYLHEAHTQLRRIGEQSCRLAQSAGSEWQQVMKLCAALLEHTDALMTTCHLEDQVMTHADVMMKQVTDCLGAIIHRLIPCADLHCSGIDRHFTDNVGHVMHDPGHVMPHPWRVMHSLGPVKYNPGHVSLGPAHLTCAACGTHNAACRMSSAAQLQHTTPVVLSRLSAEPQPLPGKWCCEGTPEDTDAVAMDRLLFVSSLQCYQDCGTGLLSSRRCMWQRCFEPPSGFSGRELDIFAESVFM